ncbi:MAG: TraC family protein [Candidatus Pacebacteria bacterium]|nr:TraC family protein [Candidatus Paceibacterota bacterium]
MQNKNAKKTQDFVTVKEIRDGVIIQKDGSLSTILMVSSINLALKSADEQQAIIMQFQHFLNSIEFPVQVFIQSQKLDIRPYVTMMEDRQKQQVNELIKIQTKEYINFIKSFTNKTNIMTKSFFIIVSYNPPMVNTKKGFGLFSSKKETVSKKISNEFEENQTQLEQRANIIKSGLTRTGVRLVRLGTEEIVELLYKLFNPGESEKPVNLN